MLPSSLMLLNTAHEYLGRRSLCCSSDGALLKFFVSLFALCKCYINTKKKQNKVMYSLTCRLYITSFFCSFFQKNMKMFLNICFCWFRCEFWKKNLQPLLAVTLTPTRRSWKWPWNSAFSVYMPTPVRRARPATLKIIHLHRL